jgi:hypothetical protein
MELVGVAGAALCLLTAALLHRWSSAEKKRPQGKEKVAGEKSFHDRVEKLQPILDDLWRAVNLPKDSMRKDLFDAVVEAFLRWTGDLPASSGYHHGEAGGLARHSLESALHAVNRLRGVGFKYMDDRGQEDPVRAYEAAAVWRYAAFVFSLFHDIGKCKSFAVNSSDGAVWEPFSESLEEFAGFSGRGILRFAFVPGRGLDNHEAFTTFMMARILPAASVRFLQKFEVLEHILLVLAGKLLPGVARSNVELFLERVKAGDQASVASDRRTPEEALPSPEEKKPLATPEAQYEQPKETKPPEKLGPPLGEYALTEFAETLRSHKLRANTPSADVLVGRKFVCLTYPGAFDLLAESVRKKYPSDIRARRLRDGKELVHSLHQDLKVVWASPQSDSWKLLCTAEYGKDAKEAGRFNCVLLVLDRLPEEARKAIEAIGTVPVSWSMRFTSEDGAIKLDDFQGPTASAYDGLKILDAMRDAALNGKLTATGIVREVYVGPHWTYFVSPVSLNVIVSPEELQRNMNDVLDALARTERVRRRADGKVTVEILTGAMRTPVHALAVPTTAFFGSEDLTRLEQEGKMYYEEVREVRET